MKKRVGTFYTALLGPAWDTDMTSLLNWIPATFAKATGQVSLNTGFQLFIILPWGSLLFKLFVTVWGNTPTFYGGDGIWVQSSFLQLVQVGFGFSMCCPFAVPNDDSITEVTHVITSLVLSFIAWYFYWGSSRLMALKEQGIDGREAFNSKRFGYHWY